MRSKVRISVDAVAAPNIAIVVTVPELGVKPKPVVLHPGQSAEFELNEGQILNATESVFFANRGHDYGDYESDEHE